MSVGIVDTSLIHCSVGVVWQSLLDGFDFSVCMCMQLYVICLVFVNIVFTNYYILLYTVDYLFFIIYEACAIETLILLSGITLTDYGCLFSSANLPPPVSKEQLGARILAQERYEQTQVTMVTYSVFNPQGGTPSFK